MYHVYIHDDVVDLVIPEKLNKSPSTSTASEFAKRCVACACVYIAQVDIHSH